MGLYRCVGLHAAASLAEGRHSALSIESRLIVRLLRRQQAIQPCRQDAANGQTVAVIAAADTGVCARHGHARKRLSVVLPESMMWSNLNRLRRSPVATICEPETTNGESRRS